MDRQKMMAQIETVTEWDIVIIGGGATGLGAAVDAASRGYKTLLVERSDFAKGTSSRSTKLVHGGVRYLAQGNVKMVREALQERGLLLKNAPHVCHNLSFIIPSFHWWQKWYYGIGLSLYDLLSGKLSIGKTQLLSKKTTLQLLPAINPAHINGGVLYHDGQFDDARLAINLAQTATEQGATIVNYCSVVQLNKTGKKISGLVLEDLLTNKKYSVTSKAVINATGVFTDKIMLMDDAQHQPIVSPSQGVHIVVDTVFFMGSHAMMIPTTDDGRVLFAVPWHNKVLLGTTDTPVKNILAEPVALPEEIDFIIKHANRYLNTGIQYKDVKAVYTGLRPLIKVSGKKTTSLLPRDHTVIIAASGLITITGGKWTTYRTMAKDAVDKAAVAGKLNTQPCVTASLNIHGYTQSKNSDDVVSVYGSDAERLALLIKENPSMGEKIHAALPYTKAMVVWAVQNEMAITVEDVLARRTRALFIDAKAAMEAAPGVASLMAATTNKNDDWQQQQVKDFNAVAANYLLC